MNTFFRKEVKALQDRFNNHYDGKVVLDVGTRQLLILGIIGLMLAAKNIQNEEDRAQRKQFIVDFMRKRSILRNVLHRLETEQRHEKKRKLSINGYGRHMTA